jgi:hypothetical protein
MLLLPFFHYNSSVKDNAHVERSFAETKEFEKTLVELRMAFTLVDNEAKPFIFDKHNFNLTIFTKDLTNRVFTCSQ